MFYNNLNGCAKIRNDIRWSISDKNVCIPSGNFQGEYETEADCIDHLHKKTHRHSCKEGEGCVINKLGDYKNYSACVEGCTLWDCSTGSCVKSSKGTFESENHCEKNLGYDCSNGCDELVCGGGYKSMEACMSDCSSWKCNLGNGCSPENGKHDGEEGYFGSKIDCEDTCSGYSCTKMIGCQQDKTSSKTATECAETCTLWSCDSGVCKEDPTGVFTSKSDCETHCSNPERYKCINGECEKADGGTHSSMQDCLKVCHKYSCEKDGCNISETGSSQSSCNDTCKSWTPNNKCETVIEGNSGYSTQEECKKHIQSWHCEKDGCVLKTGLGGYSTEEECKTKCNSWYCSTNGCENKAGNGGSKTNNICNETCLFSCGTSDGCIKDSNGPYKGLDQCKTHCPNYKCNTDGTTHECVKSIYGEYTSQTACETVCNPPVKELRYPKNANGVWFIGEDYKFDVFATMSDIDMNKKYGWLLSDEINVISLSFANPLSLLTGLAGRTSEKVDSNGLPLGMSNLIQWLNKDNERQDGRGNKRVVMIVVGGWNNSVCSTVSDNCDNSSPCQKCYEQGGCNCDEFALGPCKTTSGYCSGNACCSITSFAGPWPVVPDNQSGEDSYQVLVPDKPTYDAMPQNKKNRLDQFGGIKICDMAAGGCDKSDCQDFWYKAFTHSDTSATTLGENFARIAYNLDVGFEIDYEPQCGWGKCTYCNDNENTPCSTLADDGISFTCTHGSSTVPFMQSLVDAYNSNTGSTFTGNDIYQPGPNFPLTLDTGGGAYWLTDVFEFAQNNIYGNNYKSQGDPIKNYMTLVNIMVDSVPIGSMNKAISCSPDIIDDKKNNLAIRSCDFAALSAAWIWAPHFISNSQSMKTLNNVKTENQLSVLDLQHLEGRKVLNADNPIWTGYYTTPGAPQGFKRLNSERTAISIFCGDGPELSSDWNSVYDNTGCGYDPTTIPPTVDILLHLLTKQDDNGNYIFYDGYNDTENKYGGKGKIGGVMYWGAGTNNERVYGAKTKTGGEKGELCETILASYKAITSTTKEPHTTKNLCNTSC